jgi:hypothetical protein
MALLGGASGAVSGGLGLIGSQKAAAAQSQAAQQSSMTQAQLAQQAIAEQRAAREQAERFGREMYGNVQTAQQPYMSAGEAAMNRLAQLYGVGANTGASDYGAFSREIPFGQVTTDPGYAFRQMQGQRALNASLSASGMRASGSMMKGAMNFGQGLASQEYQNAYARAQDAYNRVRQQRLDTSAGLGGLQAGGQTAANALTGAATGLGSSLMQGALGTGRNIANTLTGTGAVIGQGLENVGQARASSYAGGVGALQGAINAPVQNYMTYSLLDQYAPRETGSYQFGGQNVPYIR